MGNICDVWYRRTTADWHEWSRPLSRVLVLLTTLLLLVMPVTEHLCNWDKFLRGGPDVEFSLLAGLLFAAMVVLSMSGTMLQPRMLRLTRMEPASALSADSQGAEQNMQAQSAASDHLRSRWLQEPASAFDSGNGFGASLPMRI